MFVSAVLIAVSECQAGHEKARAERELISAMTEEQFERYARMREVRAAERFSAAADRESRRKGFFVGRTPPC